MNPLEAQLEYRFGDAVPEPGALQEVTEGLFWLRMGLPFALNHINLWLLEDEYQTETGMQRGWTVIDCGISNDVTRDSWETIFASHLRGLPIVRVIVTHCHPDHVGLANWLCARWNAPLWMTAGDYAFARMMSAGLQGTDGTASLAHFQRHGLNDAGLLDQLKGRNSYYPTLVPAMPGAYRRMQDGQPIVIGGRQWCVITGFGHAPEHASLYCRQLNMLISGDMVLPRISTNVSVFSVEPESNPVQLYLESLRKYADLPDDTLVLPSHGKPFRGLHTRITQLNDHHAARLAEVVDACAVPRSAMDIVPIMFPRALGAHQLTFALGEALAHLHKLWFDGTIERAIGADGVFRFTRS